MSGLAEVYDEMDRKVADEERRTAECQKEIRRLRGIVRQYGDIEKQITEPEYEKLFEVWADFEDEASPVDVLKVCLDHDLYQYDAMSFKAFCAGFAAAAAFFKEE